MIFLFLLPLILLSYLSYRVKRCMDVIQKYWDDTPYEEVDFSGPVYCELVMEDVKSLGIGFGCVVAAIAETLIIRRETK